uniref:Uncharacterized protein n=1 Tax=Ananas comosus var. bracteatus TaxID=296719 RepID=A0A6V7NMS6_ANACO|nr:unnamed protein product [Ananas comosus var. bracteatus]
MVHHLVLYGHALISIDERSRGRGWWGCGEPGPVSDLGESGDAVAADNAAFDASQYAFFGKGIVEEVELGGLEDEIDNDTGSGGPADEEYHFSSFGNREEVEGLGSLSDIDDLTSTFAKLNRVVNEPRHAGVIGDRGSFSRESSSTSDWIQEAEYPSWTEQQFLDAESAQEAKRWWSHPDRSLLWLADSKPLYRTSSYPQQQPQHHLSEQILVPKSSFPSYPSPGGGSRSYPSLNLTRHSSIPSLSSGLHLPSPSASFSGLSGLPHGRRYGGSLPFTPSNLSISGQPQNHWSFQANQFAAEHLNLLPGLLQQFPHPDGLIPSSRLLSQQQQQQLQLSLPYPHLQSHLFNRHPQPIRDQRSKPSHRGRHNATRLSQQSSDASSQKSETGWLQFRSKYMSAEEIESILRMQHAATHSNDPYIDDYYHQACLAKNEQHAYLHVDALGRVSFSSIRRPRPLLEVEPPSSASGNGVHEQKSSVKPLEQEPMLAARITVEDGLCLLLDVDDIDRLLQSSQSQDGGFHLKRRREVLLEGLATSLQLVDPLGRASLATQQGLDHRMTSSSSV